MDIDDIYREQLDEYFQSIRRLPRAKLRWDKQRTLWKATEFKDIHHSIFLTTKKEEESLLPPIQIHPDVVTTNAVYSKDPAFDHKVQEKLKNILGVPQAQKVDQNLFTRLSNPKRPLEPPLPADVLLALKPKRVPKDFFDRLYSERLHKDCEHEDDDEARNSIGKGKHIDAATIARLSAPKQRKAEELPPLTTIGKKPADVNALIGRLSKPRYYVVWKNKE